MYSVLVLGEVCREHAFRTRYTCMCSVLVLAVATPKCVVHTLFRTRYTYTYIACLFYAKCVVNTLLERGIHTCMACLLAVATPKCV